MWEIYYFIFMAALIIAVAKIVSKAGYPGWIALLIMFIPVVNVISLLIFAFSEWPIETKLIRPQGQNLQFHQLSEKMIIWLARYPSPEEMFSKAIELESQGRWADAVAVFDKIAERREGKWESECARYCAQQLHQKMNRT